MKIRDAELRDAGAVADIYDHYVLNSHATFEVDTVGVEQMASRMHDSLTSGLPFLVAVADDEIRGYAVAQPYKTRAAYQHSVEISVYVRPQTIATGLGSSLYQKLFERLRRSGVHAVIAGISLPNDASIRLHEKFGMTKVAHFPEVGNKFGRWIDVGYWHLVLSDRSD